MQQKEANFRAILGAIGRRLPGAAPAAAPVVNHARPLFNAAMQAQQLVRQHNLNPVIGDALVSNAMRSAMAPAASRSGPGFARSTADAGMKELFSTVGGIIRENHSHHLGMARDAAKLHLEKQLNPTTPHNPLLAIGTNLAAMAGGAAVLGGGAMVMDQIKLNSSYQKMLKLYPELQREQPERVKQYFDAIASGSPDVAGQPLVVGSLIKRMMNYDGFDPTTYQELVSTQSNLDRGRAESFKNVLTFGDKTMGTLHTYGIGSDPNRR